jgi:xylulokinase
MAETCFLGIDVSTTGSKALLLDAVGGVLGSASTPHTLQTPRPLWSEQNPKEWWEAVRASVRTVLTQTGRAAGSIQAVGLTGQMHGLVLLDGRGEVVRPAILWNDQRTQAECDEIHRRFGRQRFIERTGNPALPGFTAPKILWVARHEPEAYARARHVLLPKDYIRYRLTGGYAMDKADGAGTVLFDLKARDWSAEVLDELGIDPSWMPSTFEGPQVTGEVSAAAAEATGLKAGTPVVAGGGDQATQAVGVGAVEAGIVAMTLGTSGVVFASTPAPVFDPEGRLHAFCHAVPGLWHLMGVMLSAAGSLRWYRDALAPNLSFDELTREAEPVPAGSEGLQFLPYLSGERTPHPDPLARAAWIGLTLRHGRAHMTRALLEGVAFGMRDCFGLMAEAGLEATRQVRVSGGGAHSPLWQQILSSVLETELATVNTTEGAALGAALLAGVGMGRWADVHAACMQAVTITGTTPPRADWVDSYRAGYSVYRELYPALAPSFAQMARG